MVLNLQRYLCQGITLGFGEKTVLRHLRENGITAGQSPIVVTNRVVERRVFTQAHQHRRLLYLEVGRVSRKIDLSSRAYADGIVEKVKLIEVHSDDFLLGVETLNTRRYHPFDRLLQGPGKDIMGSRGPDLLDQLLRQGRTATAAAEQEDGPRQRLGIYAGVLVKTYILCGYQSINEVGTQFRITDPDTVLFTVITSHRLHIG